MSQTKAMVRELVERIDGVAQTYFELEIAGHHRKKTLVVEVDFDLDPNSGHYSRAKLDAIEDTFATVIREDNADIVSKLKIVGRAQRATDRAADNTGARNASAKGPVDHAQPQPH
ncbi:hypothetical protein [Bradyrhizobium sp. BR13661]|jgi:hypothetical protein|uniref:hypothetical protein n=1 Tax=Bradyrhizobium sp. BR13661 TaxID=2940622 RepID=UPI0024768A11|nr:hypothetical protein [Bradyrhizobium sp. BR13661]MDH6262060.1 ATP-dependent DNA ligase [Bradyrhizobium sp. BR13661]